MHKETILSNGLRVIVTPLEGTQSVTVLCLVGAGSRYENRPISGISHYLEHLFFKGAKRFKNAHDVSAAIDSVGGDFNAFTGKEYAGYYVKLAHQQKKTAFDVIGDMMINASLLAEEVDRERGVILEEYNMYQDTPMYQVGWDFERLIFGDQPIGWDEIGTLESIHAITREQIWKYKHDLYTPDNIVISVAGHVEEMEILELAHQYFPFHHGKRAFGAEPYQKLTDGERVRLQNKKTEQAHLMLGVEGLPARHPDEYAQRVLSVVLGGNMSSRMFMQVRENKGLSYYIRTQTDEYADTGTFSTSAGVALKRIDLAIQAILEEYRKIMETEVGEEELKKAKEFLKGKIILRLEDSEEYAHLMGKQALLYPAIESVHNILKKIDAVKAEDILRLSKELFKEDRLKMALIGPYEDKEHFASLLHY